MYCYPCRSRELIRAGCCWFMLFELLIKIILVVLCYSVNSYMIPLKYSVAEAAEVAETFPPHPPKAPLYAHTFLEECFLYEPCPIRSISADCTILDSHLSIVRSAIPRTSACFTASCLVKSAGSISK